MPAIESKSWNVVLVEDDAGIRNEVREYLEGEEFGSRKLRISEFGDLDEALYVIRERKADLVILDIYRGVAQRGGEQTGVKILENIKQSGFVAVVIYTALPEEVAGHTSAFVRLVGKEHGGLPKLKEEIAELFRLRIPQMHRAVVNHIDEILCSYMWGFVEKRWSDFQSLAEKPEFLRLVIQRLAVAFAQEGVEKMVAEVFGGSGSGGPGGNETVHPAEYYIKPPVNVDPVLGDIRLRGAGVETEYLLVLWPSCDMVTAGGRAPKTDRVLCAKATPLGMPGQLATWVREEKTEQIGKLIRNSIAPPGAPGSPDRYHYLPGVWDIPHLIVDFQALEHLDLSSVCGFRCLGTLASPFAEALGTRFRRYLGRPGTPDLDLDAIIASLKSESGA